MEPEATPLDRHYSTIGIEDVFLDPPPHKLPQEYLNEKETAEATVIEFTSWEIVGTIKTSAEDFIVREIAPKGRRIDGLTEEQIETRRIADLLPEDDEPEAKASARAKRQATTNRDGEAANLRTNDDPVNSVQKDDPAKWVDEATNGNLLTVLQASKIKESPDTVFRDIVELQEVAKSLLSDVRRGDDACEKLPDCVVITPVGDEDSKADRSAFHRLLRFQFPLLLSDTVSSSTTSNSGAPTKEYKMQVGIDTKFHGLIPFLYSASEDVAKLYTFFKRGFEATEKGGDTKVVLRLRPDLPRNERRGIHEILHKESGQMLGTTTLPKYPLDIATHGEASTTAAIVVSWSGTMKRRMSNKRKRDQNGASSEYHFLFVLRKRDREHLAAVQLLAKGLRCRQSDIGMAGIKDMRAITYQFCTVSNVNHKQIQSARQFLEEQRMDLGPVQKVDWKLEVGALEGNSFEVTIRDLKRVHVRGCQEEQVPLEESHIAKMVDRIRRHGFVNFYGEQRVGIPGQSSLTGVRAFDIGKAMLRQDFAKAVDLLMTGRRFIRGNERESDEAQKFREVWKRTGGDVEKSYNALPRGAVLLRERTVLKGLKRYGKNKPLDGLRCLHWNERLYFVHAYQSYVWNKMASARLKLYGARVVEGDLVSLKGDGKEEVRAVEKDLATWTIQDVVLPLPGVGIEFPKNAIGDLYRETLARDGVITSNDGPPEGTAKGNYRRLVVDVKNIKYEIPKGERAGPVSSASLSFCLPKGSFATMLLRELSVTTVDRM